jgi:hypothetical protein
MWRSFSGDPREVPVGTRCVVLLAKVALKVAAKVIPGGSSDELKLPERKLINEVSSGVF